MAERAPVGYEVSITIQEFTSSGEEKVTARGPNSLLIIDKPELMGPLLVEWESAPKSLTGCGKSCEDCITNFLYFKETRDFVKVINPQDFFDLVRGHLRLSNLV